MKKRYLCTLLFGIPGLFLAAIVSFFIVGAPQRSAQKAASLRGINAAVTAAKR